MPPASRNECFHLTERPIAVVNNSLRSNDRSVGRKRRSGKCPARCGRNPALGEWPKRHLGGAIRIPGENIRSIKFRDRSCLAGTNIATPTGDGPLRTDIGSYPKYLVSRNVSHGSPHSGTPQKRFESAQTRCPLAASVRSGFFFSLAPTITFASIVHAFGSSSASCRELGFPGRHHSHTLCRDKTADYRTR
jgi:hypothetical protein